MSILHFLKMKVKSRLVPSCNTINIVSLLRPESTSKLKRPLEGSSSSSIIISNSTSFENGKLNLGVHPFWERRRTSLKSPLLCNPVRLSSLTNPPPPPPSERSFLLWNMYYNITLRGNYFIFYTTQHFRFTVIIMHTWSVVNILATKFTTEWPMSGPTNILSTKILRASNLT